VYKGGGYEGGGLCTCHLRFVVVGPLAAGTRTPMVIVVDN
jgi:hypothetical protein